MRLAALLLLATGVIYGKDPMPLFPNSFQTAMTMTNSEMMFRFYCNFAVDESTQKIAMEIEHPFEGDMSKEIGHMYALIDFKNARISLVDETNDECISAVLSHESEPWRDITAFNPWLHIYGMYIDENRMPTPNEIKLFLQNTANVTSNGIEEVVDGVNGTKWSFEFLLSQLDNTYLGEEDDKKITLDWIWSKRGVWHTGWGWPGYMALNDSFPMLTKLEMQPNSPIGQGSYFILINYAFISPNTASKYFFQIPSHVFCDSDPSVTFPTWGPFYSFESEIAITEDFVIANKTKNGHIFYGKSYFDVQHGLSWLEYESVDSTISNSTTPLPFKEVHDYNTNTLFRWRRDDPRNCEIIDSMLEEGHVDADDVREVARYHLWHDTDFFNTNQSYHYGRESITRGAETTVLVNRRTDWGRRAFVFNRTNHYNSTNAANVTSVWEWYITKDNWIADEVFATERKIPLRLDLTLHIINLYNESVKRDGTVTYNLFNFDPKELYLGSAFDIEHCSKRGPSNDGKTLKSMFELKMSDYCRDKIEHLKDTNRISFLNDLHKRIMEYSGLETLLRIKIENNDFHTNTWRLIFSLYGGFGSNRSKQLDIEDATKNLTVCVKEQRFVLPTISDVPCIVEEMTNFSPEPSPEPSPASKGFSGGVVATVALIMFLGGILLSLFFIFLVSNRERLTCLNLSRSDDLVSLVQ